MSRKKIDRTPVRRECLSLAMGQLMLSDFDDIKHCVVRYEKKCKKYEKRHSFRRSLVMTILAMAAHQDYLEEDEMKVNQIINQALNKHDLMIMAPKNS